MAIDYREEWEKFKIYYRYRKVEAEKVGAGATIGELMDDWIKAVIDSREKLMEEFVKQRMTTNIVKQDKHCYYVDIVVDDGIFGRFAASRNEFRTWLKNRKKGGKVMNEYVRRGLKTDIVGGDKDCYQISIDIWGNIFGRVSIGKDDFKNWLKNRKKGGK